MSDLPVAIPRGVFSRSWWRIVVVRSVLRVVMEDRRGAEILRRFYGGFSSLRRRVFRWRRENHAIRRRLTEERGSSARRLKLLHAELAIVCAKKVLGGALARGILKII
jgi:hypothetical protein